MVLRFDLQCKRIGLECCEVVFSTALVLQSISIARFGNGVKCLLIQYICTGCTDVPVLAVLVFSRYDPFGRCPAGME